MAAPPRSILEDAARLDALFRYEILDTPPEADFDDVVAMAKTLCDVPVALISLVAADRQWFKARAGLSLQETPINQSICAHTIAQRSMLVIADLTDDDRTVDNPLVTAEDGFRFYAGVPLRSAEGELIGALCVLDTVPHPGGLTPAQAEGLAAMARHTMKLMELRGVVHDQNRALRQASQVSRAVLAQVQASEVAGEQLQQDIARAIAAQEAGRIGIFDVDLTTDLARTSPQMCRLYGLPEAAVYPTTVFEPLAVEEDRHLRSTRETRRSGTADLAVEYRIRRADDGAVRWVYRRGEFIRDGDGNALRFVGTLQDVTERRLGELRQTAMLLLGDATRDSQSTAEVVTVAARILGETLDASRVGYGDVDLTAGTLTIERDWAAPDCESIAGRFTLNPDSRILGRLKSGEVVAADRSSEMEWMSDAISDRLGAGVEAQIRAPLIKRGELVGVFFVQSAKARHWSKDELEFVASFADRTYATLAKIQAERDQRLLNEELSHRLKNNLAMVQAIAKQTLRSVRDRPAVEALDQRLVALGTAHEILLQQNWNAAPVLTVMERVLALHSDLARFEFGGPALALTARTVLSMSMLLHELATNALKYGSLSTEHGKVGVHWATDQAAGAQIFTLAWTESGGPPAIAPERQGFGSRLIRYGLAGTGNVVLRYEQSGFNASFRAPLDLVIERLNV